MDNLEISGCRWLVMGKELLLKAVGVVIKEQQEGSCSHGTVQYHDCRSEYTKLHVIDSIV